MSSLGTRVLPSICEGTQALSTMERFYHLRWQTAEPSPPATLQWRGSAKVCKELSSAVTWPSDTDSYRALEVGMALHLFSSPPFKGQIWVRTGQ